MEEGTAPGSPTSPGTPSDVSSASPSPEMHRASMRKWSSPLSSVRSLFRRRNSSSGDGSGLPVVPAVLLGGAGGPGAAPGSTVFFLWDTLPECVRFQVVEFVSLEEIRSLAEVSWEAYEFSRSGGWVVVALRGEGVAVFVSKPHYGAFPLPLTPPPPLLAPRQIPSKSLLRLLCAARLFGVGLAPQLSRLGSEGWVFGPRVSLPCPPRLAVVCPHPCVRLHPLVPPSSLHLLFRCPVETLVSVSLPGVCECTLGRVQFFRR